MFQISNLYQRKRDIVIGNVVSILIWTHPVIGNVFSTLIWTHPVIINVFSTLIWTHRVIGYVVSTLVWLCSQYLGLNPPCDW